MLHLRLIILSVGGDVLVGSETLLINDFVNLKMKAAQSFECAHGDRVCTCIHISDYSYVYEVSVFVLVSKKYSVEATVKYAHGVRSCTDAFSLHARASRVHTDPPVPVMRARPVSGLVPRRADHDSASKRPGRARGSTGAVENARLLVMERRARAATPATIGGGHRLVGGVALARARPEGTRALDRTGQRAHARHSLDPPRPDKRKSERARPPGPRRVVRADEVGTAPPPGCRCTAPAR
jgi:hypothetical protein